MRTIMAMAFGVALLGLSAGSAYADSAPSNCKEAASAVRNGAMKRDPSRALSVEAYESHCETFRTWIKSFMNKQTQNPMPNTFQFEFCLGNKNEEDIASNILVEMATKGKR